MSSFVRIPACTITFYMNGGEGTLESISAEAGQYVVLPSAESASKSISRKGYKLLGFSDNTDIAYPLYDYKMPYENVKMFAVWEPDTFTVNYNSNGGTGQLSRAKFYTATTFLCRKTFQYTVRDFS